MALISFEKTRGLWGRGKAEIYASLIEFKLGNSEQAQVYFDKTKKTNEKLNNPQHFKQIEEISNSIEFPMKLISN